MADNVQVTAGSGTSLRTDEISGVHHQVAKIEFGTDGSATMVDGSNPLPVVQTGTLNVGTLGTVTNVVHVDDNSGSITVDGTVTVQATNLDIRDLTSASDSVTSVPTVAAGALTGANPNDDTAGVTGIALKTMGLNYAYSGTDWVRVRGDVSNGLDVDVTRLPALATGTNTIGSVKITDGTDVADVLDLTNSNPLTVAIVDGSGTQLTSFGGGTQYTEADTDASITGTAILWEDTSDTLRSVSAAKPLPVNIISGAGSGGTAAADDADFTAGTTSGTPAMGVYESTPTTVTDGDLGTVGITSGRRMKTSATIDAALPAGTNNIGDVDVLSLPTLANVTTLGTITNVVHIDDNAGSVTVDGTVAVSGTVAVTQSGTWDEVGINDSGNSITIDAPVGTPAFVRLSDGSSAISTLPVSLASVPSHAVTNAGTFAVQATLQAGTALAGQVSASDETSTIYNGTTALTPKFAKIAASSSGDNTLVAAVTSKKIRVLAYNFIANGTVNAKFQSGAAGTDLTGLKYCVANMGLVAPYNPLGWFETASNTLLNLNLSGAVAVGGELTYCEV